MNRPIFALVACAALLLPRLTFGEQVQNLYEATVPVVSQGEEARRAGLVEALQTVMVKLSGASGAPRNPAFAEALSAPDRFVDQFRYVAPVTGASGQSLWVRFDSRSIDQLLRSNGISAWGANRPAVVVWLSTEEKGKRTLLGSADAVPVTVALQAAAARRGLPLHLPLLDLEDTGRLQPADVWAGFGDVIQAASVRYRGQAVLTGALNKESDGWRARWTLYREGVVLQKWESLGSLEAAVNAGIDQTTDELARLFAAPARGEASGGPLELRVTGVRTLEQFFALTNYLRTINGVTAVQPSVVEGELVVLSVAFQGSAQGLAQALALGDTLIPVQDAAAPAPAELSYRLSK